MLGRATLAIVLSSDCRIEATITVSVIMPRWLGTPRAALCLTALISVVRPAWIGCQTNCDDVRYRPSPRHLIPHVTATRRPTRCGQIPAGPVRGAPPRP